VRRYRYSNIDDDVDRSMASMNRCFPMLLVAGKLV
jgi:hypothetical protein